MKNLSMKKLYYSISEVSKITEVEQYVLRYWETEFEGLNPQKNRAGNRIYTNKDIQLIMQIKSLLRDKKYTIIGAKKILENYSYENSSQTLEPELKSNVQVVIQSEVKKDNYELKKDLAEIKTILEFLVNKL